MGFYPHGKPAYYSYTTHFLEVGHDYGGASYGHTLYPGLNGRQQNAVTNKALANLQNLINAARAAEKAFLADTGIDVENANASNIFRHMNEIFNSRQTFERGLQYMKSINASGKMMDKGEMYRDVSRYFGTYLSQILRSELKRFLAADIVKMSQGQIKALINDIIGDALIRTYERVADYINEDTNRIRGKFGDSNKGKAAIRDNEKEVQAVKDMIQTIEKLKGLGAFKEYGYLFNLSEDTLKQMTDRKDRRYRIKLDKKKFNGAQVDANFGGNILELITSVVAAEIGNINIKNEDLTITGVHTGQMNQMKADTILFVGKGQINPQDYLKLTDQSPYESVRMQNVEAMSKYLKKLDDNLKHVIMISDKNYSITASFGGVNAQEKMSLQHVGGMLSQFGVGQVVELVNYLANCGPEMVQGAVNGEIRTELQTLIGYFLFDHLQINVSGGGSPGPNVVNMMNVSGMYIPLSVYLEGVLHGLQNALNNPTSFVSVTISLGGQTEQKVWTAGTWGEFRESHETQTFISYRILKDIASFISAL